MSVAGTVSRGRTAAERLMVDACTITRGGQASFDENTGVRTSGSASTVYAGKCRVQVPNVAEQTPTFGEMPITTQLAIVQVPVSVVGVRVEDTVTVTESQDPDLVDRTFRVVALLHKTHLTARRLRCEEVAG